MKIKWPYVEVDKDYMSSDVEGVKRFYLDSDVQARDFDDEVPFYVQFITNLLVSREPSSIFEFGCNAGRNLHLLAQRLPQARLHGIDLNREAIEFGRTRFGLPIEVGDETTLASLDDDSFEITFTISVLDHIPFIRDTVKELIRITGRYLILYEICHDQFGRIVKMTSERGEIVDGYPFSYFHDYDNLLCELGTWCVLDASIPAFSGNLGEFYRLKIFTKHSDAFGKDHLKKIDLNSL
jgi:SAM-dependent methyltransferase